MPDKQINKDQILFSGIKAILDNADLKTFEKMIMIVIKVYRVEYGDVFPDYDTIAAAGGMSKRKAQYVIKDLQERNMVEKFSRFKDLPDGGRKQTSNRYLVVEDHDAAQDHNLDAQYAQPSNSTYAQHAPYNAGFNNQDSLDLYPSTELNKEEEDYLSREHEIECEKYACYAEIYERMIRDQGSGMLCYKQMEFLDTCQSYNLPACLVTELYPHVRTDIQKYHVQAISRSFEKFVGRLARNRIDNPIAWFVATFRNEDLKVRTELQLHQERRVS